MNKSLLSSEWFFLGSFLILLTSLFVISQESNRRNEIAIASLSRAEKIPVTVRGAVAKPGVYRLHPGELLEVAIKRARPKKFANLKELPLALRVEAPQQVEVGELEKITVTVQGEVLEPVQFSLLAGTRVSDLKSKIRFAKDADQTVFKSQRRLAEGEILTVPKKAVE